MTNIYVSNLPYDLEESELRREFEFFGRVVSVRIVTDPATRRSRGFAFVTMPSMEDADEAIHRLTGKSFHGRQLRVSEANDDRNSSRPADPTAGANHAREVFDRLFSGSNPATSN
ncbi:RNA recognition motif (RRM, RBD, or RNP domain) [Polystyrenella longa]|uniref:RNA recognition motif (RRM, RBD, or RNP domain) n=1 Tax=Polystyrenella longa TaxID=2528007 RepID=A0A518CPJ4_9PLAN|nr:RNA-binding protein [Polystyrenella longa]QDU81149.1 RNA recognition motif (RRM, RBD, or RNP domain) [Polystyrenella longa]